MHVFKTFPPHPHSVHIVCEFSIVKLPFEWYQKFHHWAQHMIRRCDKGNKNLEESDEEGTGPPTMLDLNSIDADHSYATITKVDFYFLKTILNLEVEGEVQLIIGLHQCQFKDCEQTYKSPYALKYHTKYVHEGKGVYCKKCGVRYPSISRLNRHDREAHLKIKFKCPACRSEFTQPHSVKDHMKSTRFKQCAEYSNHCEYCRQYSKGYDLFSCTQKCAKQGNFSSIEYHNHSNKRLAFSRNMSLSKIKFLPNELNLANKSSAFGS